MTKITYQQQYRKCGKPHCSCQNGKLHGPYWYAYYHQGGKLRSKYLGKERKEFVPDANTATSQSV